MRGKAATILASTTTESSATVAIPTTPPATAEEQCATAAMAVRLASEAGVTNQRLRFLLPSPRIKALIAPDESWEGGIMQLYGAISPLVRDLVKKLSPVAGGVPARLREQRLDVSGVDGEGLWTSECASAADDVSALVQPSSEQLSNIQAICKSANGRLVLMVNPQYRDSDDTMDFIASKGGLFGSMASYLGGKAKFVQALDDLGFETTFAYEQYVIRGSEMKYLFVFGQKWQIFITDDDGEALRIGESVSRPDYNSIDAFLEKNLVAAKALRDLGTAPRLTSESIKSTYSG